MKYVFGSGQRCVVGLFSILLLIAAPGVLKSADHIPITGVRANNEGSAAYNLAADPRHNQPDGGISYYRLASVEFDGIDPASLGGGRGAGPVVGFPNTVATLQSLGRSVADLRIRFGEATLGGHVEGVDYSFAGTIQGGDAVETRLYRGGVYKLMLLDQEMLSGPMPDLTMSLRYNGSGFADDQYSGVTAPFVLTNSSAGSSPAAQQVAAALLQDIGAGQLRNVFDGFEPITQTEINSNGRLGSYFDAPVGRLELVPPPPDLAIGNAVVREGGVLEFNVSLRPASDQVVTVDFSVVGDTATMPDDFTHPGGTLTFAVGETDKTISVGTVNDAEVEINEELRVVLSNPNGAPLHRDTGIGVILDNDDPGFPGNDSELFPQEAPCICTPLAGIYNTNVSEIWNLKMLGGNATLRVAAVTVNNTDASTVEALVYDGAGNLVGSNQVSYTSAEAAANPLQWAKWVDISLPGRAAGEVLRVQVHNLPPTPLTQTHYRLHAAGVRWMSTPSPSFAGFESDPARWRFVVQAGEDLDINFFTNNLPGVAPIDYMLIDPAGGVVLSATNAPIVPGPEIHVPGATPGVWALAMQARDHYRLSKISGADRAIYADWRTGSFADEHVFIRLDGTNAVGTEFDVVLDRLRVYGGVTNVVHYRSQLTTTGSAVFSNVPQGVYRISVNPTPPGIAAPAPQFEFMACDHPLTNVFDVVSGGDPGGAPSLHVGNNRVWEPATGTTPLDFQVRLSHPHTDPVTVDYSVMDRSAYAGIDFANVSGTLTFAPGETNKVINVDVFSDPLVEPVESFWLLLANANGAAIADPSALGVIRDSDRPDFPGDGEDPNPLPDGPPCICLPGIGIYDTNSPHAWAIRPNGGALDVEFTAYAVNNADPSEFIVRIYDAAGGLVASNRVGYSAAEVATNALPFERTISLSLGTPAPSERFMLDVELGAGVPITQAHYKFKVCGARWVGMASPGQAGLESDSAFWKLRVLPGDANLTVNLFTNDLPNHGSFEYVLVDPAGNVHSTAPGEPIVPGAEISVPSPAAGLWTLFIDPQDHYRISKVGGADTTIYADWRTAGDGTVIGRVDLNGSPAVGTAYNVELFQQLHLNGVLTNINFGQKLVTNAFFGFHPLSAGTYVTRVIPVSPSISTPPAATNMIFCDQSVTNVFQTTGDGGNPPGDGPPPVLTLLPGAVVERDAGETNHLVFEVKLSHPSAQPVSVEFTTHDSAAQSGSDYDATSRTITIAAGATTMNVAVPVIGDDVQEQRYERFNATLANPTNAVVGIGFANGVIVDNDGANDVVEVAFVAADEAVYEGNSGFTTLTVPVFLTRTNNVEVRVDYATRNATATEPSDYAATSGTLVFPPGTLSQSLTVSVQGDMDVEADESFWVDFSNPVNAVLNPDADLIGSGKILNDDQDGGPPGNGSAIYVRNGRVREGDVSPSMLSMEVHLWPPAAHVVTVDLETADWTALGGVDYVGQTNTLTFAPNVTNQTVDITILPDGLFEPTELLYLNAANVSGATIGHGHGIGVIQDNDHPDFPPDGMLPDPLPCICTPVIGNYNSNAVHGWAAKAAGGPLDLELKLTSVNTNEPAMQVIRVYDSTGILVASNSVTMSLAEVQSMPNYTESVAVPAGTRAPGEVMRIEVESVSGPLNAHYSLKACGARWLGTASPSFSAFEEEPTRYRFVVQAGEDLNLDIFTNSITPDVTSQVPLRLIDPAGNLVPLGASPTAVMAGDEIHVPGAMAGVWTLEANLTNRVIGHYRLAKTSGANRGIYFDWSSGGHGVIHTRIMVNGNPPAAGTAFNLDAWRQVTFGGSPALETLVSGVISNNYTFDLDPYEMLPGTYVTRLVPVDPALGGAEWRTNTMMCMTRATNTFNFTGTGGPTGPTLYAVGGMVRERDAVAGTLDLEVRLWPPAGEIVTVDYALADLTATASVDYQPDSGTLTFPVGTTNLMIPVTVLPDTLPEPVEFLRLELSNASGATIRDAQSRGVIKDNDRFDFPGDGDDSLPFPSEPPCVCTPLTGQYETEGPQTWLVRSSGGPMTLRLYAYAVNTNDGSTIIADVYGPSGGLISRPFVSYTAAEAAAGGIGFEKWVDVPLGSHAAGDVLRVEVGLGAGTPSTQTHYRLGLCGARWVGTHSPSFAGFEDDGALWRLRVLPGDAALNIDFFATNTPTMATGMHYVLYDPSGAPVTNSLSGGSSIVAGDEISIASPTPGLWALRCRTTQDHYRLAKSGGVDNALYLGWRGASWGELTGHIRLNGTSAAGTPYEVRLHYQWRVSGVITNVLVDTMTTTSGMFHFERMQHGDYVVEVMPTVPGITPAAPQSIRVSCDDRDTLVFQTFGGGTGGPLLFIRDLHIVEGDATTTGFFDIFLTEAVGSSVTVEYSSGSGSATAGVDYDAISGVANIPAGGTNVMIGVTIHGDAQFERNETVRINLVNPVNAALGLDHGEIVIVNDDRPRAARFERIASHRLADGRFRLGFDTGDDGALYHVEASDDLRQWFKIGEVTGTPTGVFEFTDTSSTNRTFRFYRAIAP